MHPYPIHQPWAHLSSLFVTRTHTDLLRPFQQNLRNESNGRAHIGDRNHRIVCEQRMVKTEMDANLHSARTNWIDCCGERNIGIAIFGFASKLPCQNDWNHPDRVSSIRITQFGFIQAIDCRWIHHFDGFVYGVGVDGVDFRAEIVLRNWFQSRAVGSGRIECVWIVFLMFAAVGITIAVGHSRIDRRTNSNCIAGVVWPVDVCFALDWTIFWTFTQSKWQMEDGECFSKGLSGSFLFLFQIHSASWPALLSLRSKEC